MDEASRAYGVGPLVEFMGQEVQVKGLSRADLALIDAEILALRGNPFDHVVEAIDGMLKLADDADTKEFVRQRANELMTTAASALRSWRNVTWQDIAYFSDTPKGEATKIWLAFRDGWKGEPLERANVEHWLRCWFDRDVSGCVEWTMTVKGYIEQASGLDTLGNSTGPSAKGPQEIQSTSENSSDTSPKSEDGLQSKSES